LTWIELSRITDNCDEMESGEQGLFWGVVLKPDKRYEQVVEEDFRITKACVDPSTLDNGKVASVILEKDNDEFIICNLTSPTGLDVQMDLAFCEGEKVTFRTEGGATVHLTGHVQPDEPDMEQMGFPGYDEGSEEEEGEEEEEGSDDDDDEEGEEEEEEEEAPKLVKKRKLENGSANGDAQSAKKQKKEAVKQAEAMKKILSKDKKKADDDEEEDDDDDSDEYEDMDDDMDQVEGENEEGSDDDDEEEEEEESPAKAKKEAAKPKETPKAKKDKKKEPAAKNGEAPSSPKKENKEAEKVKEEAPKTPAKAETEPETPKSKKKKNKNKFKEGGENGQQQAKTPAKDGAAKTPAKDGAAKTPAKDGAPKTPAKKTLKGGIVVEDLKVGNGPEAKSGKMVGMYYDGKLTQGGKRFDACKSGKPFKFKLGKGEVIKGWDVGLEGIKVGGKRKLTIPAHMAYGAAGAGPDIPPNASLTFEVECKTVN